MPDNTGNKQAETQFKPGKSGNPAGRPKGARNKLGSDFLDAMQADFAEHGQTVIAVVRAEKPADYLKIVASILPKELHLKDATLEDMTDDELANTLAAVRNLIATGAAKAAGAGKQTADGEEQPRPVRTVN